MKNTKGESTGKGGEVGDETIKMKMKQSTMK